VRHDSNTLQCRGEIQLDMITYRVNAIY